MQYYCETYEGNRPFDFDFDWNRFKIFVSRCIGRYQQTEGEYPTGFSCEMDYTYRKLKQDGPRGIGVMPAILITGVKLEEVVLNANLSMQ